MCSAHAVARVQTNTRSAPADAEDFEIIEARVGFRGACDAQSASVLQSVAADASRSAQVASPGPRRATASGVVRPRPGAEGGRRVADACARSRTRPAGAAAIRISRSSRRRDVTENLFHFLIALFGTCCFSFKNWIAQVPPAPRPPAGCVVTTLIVFLRVAPNVKFHRLFFIRRRTMHRCVRFCVYMRAACALCVFDSKWKLSLFFEIKLCAFAFSP